MQCSTIALVGMTLVSFGSFSAAQRPGPGSTGHPSYGTIVSKSPWFVDQSVRNHLHLTPDQYLRLNNAYAEAWARYQKEVAGLGTNLTPEQRAKRMQDFEMAFHRNFEGSFDNAITDPERRQRFQQMYYQYRGFDAFYDPLVRKQLQLTQEQRLAIEKERENWLRGMSQVRNQFNSDREGATRQFQTLLKKDRATIQGILTPTQQRSWQEMTGESFVFPPSAYFGPSTRIEQGN